ncbi:uncharacterized protein LOC129600527 [Paramacrobiotus metropolitanus]|uniref:uncharacterized protein LOC129600527 n=1 Tax=Paramacrobiotus metropolitanus TaxID=2943436 RepID=UPI0024462E79|nr:uncharacterized protein LOC129600527 [Paramacrobiotus metropolitanus]
MDGEKKRPRRKTSTSERKASRKSRFFVSNSGTELAIAQNPRLSAVSSIPVDLGAVVSQRKLQEAERLLHQMSAPALLQLKRLLRGKADAVQRDLALLEENETTLCELGTKLQEEKSTLEDDKCRLSEQLTMMRDNLCKVTNFSCQIFELRGGAVMEETVTDQWTERADMLQKMERMIAKGIEEDAKVTKEFEAAERDWQKLMLEYAGYEQQIVAAHNRREDLQNQIRNYEELSKKQESQLRELKLLRKEHGDEMSNRAAGIALLRQKVIEQLGPEYSLDRVDKVITGHQQFEHDLEETLVEVQALVMQVESDRRDSAACAGSGAGESAEAGTPRCG